MMLLTIPISFAPYYDALKLPKYKPAQALQRYQDKCSNEKIIRNL